MALKPRTDLATNSNDIDSLLTEMINKKIKMLSLVHSIDKQRVILNNIKHRNPEEELNNKQ